MKGSKMNKIYAFDRVYNKIFNIILSHKTFFILLVFTSTPIITFLLSLLGSNKNPLEFTLIITIILFVIYFNIIFAKRNYKIAIVLVFVLSFVLKMFIASQLFGTYDMESFYIVADIMKEGVTTNIYAETDRYNYSPIWSYVLYLNYYLSRATSIALSTVIKFSLIIFDIFTAILLYKINENSNKGEKERFIVVASFLYSPITIMVSSYGAQFENIALYFLLLYIYIGRKRQYIWHHLLYGLSIAVKQVTILPIAFLTLRQKGTKIILFLILAAIPFTILITPYLSEGLPRILNNVIGYAGTPGFWGYSRAIRYVTLTLGLYKLEIIFTFLMLKIMTVVMFAIMFYYFNKYSKINLLNGIIISYLLFYTLAPGFGAQYLVWILPFAVLRHNHFYYVYSLLGSLVVFFFYYGHGTGDLFIREVLAFSLVGPLLWVFCIYWLFRHHLEVKKDNM